MTVTASHFYDSRIQLPVIIITFTCHFHMLLELHDRVLNNHKNDSKRKVDGNRHYERILCHTTLQRSKVIHDVNHI